MASVEILLRALTVSRQLASGVLLYVKVAQQIRAPAVANATDGELDLHDTWCHL